MTRVKEHKKMITANYLRNGPSNLVTSGENNRQLAR